MKGVLFAVAAVLSACARTAEPPMIRPVAGPPAPVHIEQVSATARPLTGGAGIDEILIPSVVCRTFQDLVWIQGRWDVAAGTACQAPDGTWRIVAR